jgi:hypothetical protein
VNIERDVRIDDAVEIERGGTIGQTPNRERLAPLRLTAVRKALDQPKVGNDNLALILLPGIVVDRYVCACARPAERWAMVGTAVRLTLRKTSCVRSARCLSGRRPGGSI